ncbi:GNAT family N-acetyltransferase [Natrialba asiatica]|uniref:N-acetyltransferase GCN5 n=1 Tax=Natrialba asiatica (strain ATCC 700177 / DSM 12278 / JCM 9576 / FERM P-10747 / NBRC 102637 / 172P1) TaxID=29540 RepID=M0AZ07_NATA1|nr:GNAT family N-acetyltransferase [Natrialba asiatica]ELZ02659.1 N-acetyltransferase GCN5 [Natrialba asiatica DSM 12278]
MEVREAVPDDADAIRTTHAASITELGTESYSQEQVDAWAAGCESADYTAAIESPDHYLVVAVAESVRGFGSLVFVAPEEYEATVDAEVTAVYVHPSVAREGVGSRIEESLERRAGERGVSALGLTASQNAVAFYRSRGYERIGATRHEFSGHESTGVYGTVVEMRKEL